MVGETWFRRIMTSGDDQSQAERLEKLNNIVFMGVGEPLLNYKNLLRAVKDSLAEGLGMSPPHHGIYGRRSVTTAARDDK
jgi:adenine C2-methylase RlmN of 23S rRNA A2503 and tRNA A37